MECPQQNSITKIQDNPFSQKPTGFGSVYDPQVRKRYSFKKIGFHIPNANEQEPQELTSTSKNEFIRALEQLAILSVCIFLSNSLIFPDFLRIYRNGSSNNEINVTYSTYNYYSIILMFIF